MMRLQRMGSLLLLHFAFVDQPGAMKQDEMGENQKHFS